MCGGRQLMSFCFNNMFISNKQLAVIVCLVLVYAVGELKLVDAVMHCIKCDSLQEPKCKSNPPSNPTFCNTMGQANAEFLCMTAEDYDSNGNSIRFVRDCTTAMKDPKNCMTNSPEQIRQGHPAKSCYWTCSSDGCNSGPTSRVASAGVLLLGGLLVAAGVAAAAV